MYSTIDNNKGSTLILIICGFALISVLCLNLLAMNTVNYKMKIIEHDSKMCYYTSEMGVEEIYIKILECVEEGIKTCKKEVQENVDLDDSMMNEQQLEDCFFSIYMNTINNNLEREIKNYKFKTIDNNEEDLKITISDYEGEEIKEYTNLEPVYIINIVFDCTYNDINNKLKAKFTIDKPLYKESYDTKEEVSKLLKVVYK